MLACIVGYEKNFSTSVRIDTYNIKSSNNGNLNKVPIEYKWFHNGSEVQTIKARSVNIDEYNKVYNKLYGSLFYKNPTQQNSNRFNPFNLSKTTSGDINHKRSLKKSKKNKRKKFRKKIKHPSKRKHLKNFITTSRYFLHDNGVLEVTALKQSDAGDYKCVVENRLESRTATVHINNGFLCFRNFEKCVNKIFDL